MGRGAWFVGLLLTSACRPAAAPPAPHEVRYRLDWAWDDAVKTTDGVAWEVTNDLGYRVRLTRGFITSYSMELVECPKTALLSLRGVALAGHSSGTPNPAAIRPIQVESLTEPTAREVGTVLLQPQAYCQLHYLIARAAREAVGLPPDLDMVDTSLHVEGTERPPGASTEAPFALHTALANGALVDRAGDAALHVDTGRETARVTVRRHLGRMFDGVDFATMTPQMVAGQILKSLVAHVEVTIESGHDSG